MLKGRVCHSPFQYPGGKENITDCYFYVINLKGINRKNNHHVEFLHVCSAIRHLLMAQIFLFLSLMVT